MRRRLAIVGLLAVVCGTLLGLLYLPTAPLPAMQDTARAAAKGSGQQRSAPGGAQFVDICGVGRVPVDPEDHFGQEPVRLVASMTRGVTTRWRAALLDSDDPRVRAAGLLLDSMNRDPSPEQAKAALEARDELVQLAAGDSDPLVYSFAVDACHVQDGLRSGDSCAQISLDGWTARDPKNAVPWLMLAGQAARAHDAAAEKDAFAHAAEATTAEMPLIWIAGIWPST